MTIGGLRFEMTCSWAPEQYDIFDEGKRVGYLRMRHGNFSVSCPDVDGEYVIDRMANGDGAFNEDERDACLNEAVTAIRKWQETA